MKTQISRNSHRPARRYSGVFQQQGRMITDADWNELMQLVQQRLQDTLQDIIGSGTPKHNAIRLDKIDTAEGYLINIELDDPTRPASLYAEGLHGLLYQGCSYTEQADYPYASQPESAGEYIFYADLWQRTVTALEDPGLLDPALHGADTCSRTQTMVQVKWCGADINPESADDNPHQGDAPLALALRSITAVDDKCDPCAVELHHEQERVGNYLFRLEVHDYYQQDNGGTITRHLSLKWSSENGAEQYLVGQEPEEFSEGAWVYEFFNAHSEKYLGIHHVSRSDGYPLNGALYVEYPENTDDVFDPAYLSEEAPLLVRRWDGYCELEHDGSQWTLIRGQDKSYPLTIDPADSAKDGFVALDANLVAKLGSKPLLLTLGLEDNTFVRGDHWLCAVREAIHQPLPDADTTIFEDIRPVGVRHHYLKLAELHTDGSFDRCLTDLECRQQHFPTLTDIRAGDVGYNVPDCPVDPAALPTVQSLLRAAVDAWPEQDSDIRNTVEYVLNALLCELAAASLPYDPTETAIQQRWDDVIDGGGDAALRPVTVQSAIDTLLLKLESSDIYYEQAGVCELMPGYGAETVRKALGLEFDAQNRLKLDAIFTALLCELDAAKLPYDPTARAEDWRDITEQEGSLEPVYPLSVQSAIDTLIEYLESGDIGYTVPVCPPEAGAPPLLKDLLDVSGTTNLKALWDTLLCDLNAKKLPYDARIEAEVENRWSDLLSGSGVALPQTLQTAVDELLKHLGQGGGGLAEIIRELVNAVALSGTDLADDDSNVKPQRQQGLSDLPVAKDNSLLDATIGMLLNLVRFAYTGVLEFLDVGLAGPVQGGELLGHSGALSLRTLASTEGYVAMWRHVLDRKGFAERFFKERLPHIAIHTAAVIIGRHYLRDAQANDEEALKEVLQRIEEASPSFGVDEGWNGDLIRQVLIEKFFAPLFETDQLDHPVMAKIRDLILEYIAELWRCVVCELLIEECKPVVLPEDEAWLEQLAKFGEAAGRGLGGDGLVHRLGNTLGYEYINDLLLQPGPEGRYGYSWLLGRQRGVDNVSHDVLSRIAHERVVRAVENKDVDCPVPELSLQPNLERKWMRFIDVRVDAEFMLLQIQDSNGLIYCAFPVRYLAALQGELMIYGDIHMGLSFYDTASGAEVLNIPFPEAVVFALESAMSQLVDGMSGGLQLIGHIQPDAGGTVALQCSTFNPLYSIGGKIPLGTTLTITGLQGVYNLSLKRPAASSHLLVVMDIPEGQVITLLQGVDASGQPVPRWIDGAELSVITSLRLSSFSYRVIGAAHDQLIVERGFNASPRQWTFVPFRALHESLWGGDAAELGPVLSVSAFGNEPYLMLNSINRDFEQGGIDDYYAVESPWIGCQPTSRQRYFYLCYAGIFPELDIVLPGGATDRSQAQMIYALETENDEKRLLSLNASNNTIEYHSLRL